MLQYCPDFQGSVGGELPRRTRLGLIEARHTGYWNQIFPDQAMLIAAIDRLVHHAIIFELDVESFCRRSALSEKKRAAASSGKRRNNLSPDSR